MKKRALLIGIALGLVSAVLPYQNAFAHTIAVDEDHTENRVAFSYDSEDGSVPSEASSRRNSTDENVKFTVVIRESQTAGSGLMGRLKLQLNGEHRTTYNGWFTLRIVDDSGDVAFKSSRPTTIRLQPRPGMRRASIPFRFDLPSGSYEARGGFERE